MQKESSCPLLVIQISASVQNKSVVEEANSKVSENGAKAREIKAKIFNATFLLQLAGVSDIYNSFGTVVQTTQMVKLLPHERLAKFTKSLSLMSKMSLCLDHSFCHKYAPKPDSDTEPMHLAALS